MPFLYTHSGKNLTSTLGEPRKPKTVLLYFKGKNSSNFAGSNECVWLSIFTWGDEKPTLRTQVHGALRTRALCLIIWSP